MADPYTVLGVTKSSSLEDIKKITENLQKNFIPILIRATKKLRKNSRPFHMRLIKSALPRPGQSLIGEKRMSSNKGNMKSR